DGALQAERAGAAREEEIARRVERSGLRPRKLECQARGRGSCRERPVELEALAVAVEDGVDAARDVRIPDARERADPGAPALGAVADVPVDASALLLARDRARALRAESEEVALARDQDLALGQEERVLRAARGVSDAGRKLAPVLLEADRHPHR